MSKHFCLYAILLLFAVSLSLQYFRIMQRKRIIKMSEKYISGRSFENDWNTAGKGFASIFKDYNRMRMVKKFAGQLPDEILHRLRKFRILCTVEQVTTLTTLLIAAFAYRICYL